MAVDLASARKSFAEAMGAEKFIIPSQQNLADEVRAWTEGYGVDAVVLATATQNNGPTEQAIEVIRDRGRIVVVGNTKVDLLWKYAYEKEISVRYSRSYGPGRYDPAYEWGGTDYPIGYVRWTEQRNFDACPVKSKPVRELFSPTVLRVSGRPRGMSPTTMIATSALRAFATARSISACSFGVGGSRMISVSGHLASKKSQPFV